MFRFIKQHRIGVLSTVLFHLLVLNLFFISKLTVTKKPAKNEVMIDLPSVPPVKEKKYVVHEAVNRDIKISDQIDYTNYAYKLEKLKEAEDKLYKNIDNEDIQKVTDEYKQEVLKRALGDDYEKYMNKSVNQDNNEVQKAKVQEKVDSLKYKKSHVIKSGPSTLVYDIDKRFGVNLPLPVYKCLEGGTVIVEIEVNRSGNVLKTTLINNQASENECLIDAALTAANASVFNSDNNAPAIQKGSIMYTFIPQ